MDSRFIAELAHYFQFEWRLIWKLNGNPIRRPISSAGAIAPGGTLPSAEIGCTDAGETFASCSGASPLTAAVPSVWH